MAEGAVEDGDAQLGVEDHHPIGALLQNGVKPLLLLVHLLIEPRVAHSDGRLFGKASQQVGRVLNEVVVARLEDVDETDHPAAAAERQADDLGESEVGFLGYAAQLVDQFRERFALASLVIGDAAHQWRKVIDQVRWDTVDRGHAQCLTARFGQSDHPRLTGNQLDGRLQDEA